VLLAFIVKRQSRSSVKGAACRCRLVKQSSSLF
jgi:hypothetical protein